MRLAFRVWQRDLKVWTKYCWASLISNLGEPILYIVAIGYGLGRFITEMDGMPYLTFLAPAVLASSVMNSASFETTFSSYTRMTVQKTFDGILVTPLSVQEVIAGEILWAATKALITAVAILLVLGAAGLITSPWYALMVLPVMLIFGVLFAAMGMVVTSMANSYDFFAYYFTLVLGPMFFFSGTFFPLRLLPGWAIRVSWFLPLTHCVRLSRSILRGDFYAGMAWDVAWLCLAAIAAFSLAVLRMSRRLVK